MDPMISALKEAQKICFAANNYALNIRNKTKIQSKLVYYESVFFLYTLNDITLNLNNVPVEITIRIKDALIKLLSHTDNVEYKRYEDTMELIISFRYKTYIDLLFKYNEKITPDFFLEAFHYQTELIIYIQENNDFMSIKQNPCSFPEWIQKAASDNFYMIILNVLMEQYEMLLDFIEFKS